MKPEATYVALAGGVGGAKFAYGLSRTIDPAALLVAVNTGDDFEHLGLSISPDLDTVCYTLAELDDTERGWGRADETWNFMDALAPLGGPSWFNLGDRDLAIHVLRTQLRSNGATLAEATKYFAGKLGIACRILPMSDDRVATIVQTDAGALAFQDYFVRQQCKPVARGFVYEGAANAAAHPEILEALESPTLKALFICPSNPWLSVGPMLALPALKRSVLQCKAPRVVISPIIGGEAVKGPAAKLMRELNIEVSPSSIARHYAELATAIVIDNVDADLRRPMERLGLNVLVTDALMRDRQDRVRLAAEIVKWMGA